VRPVTCYTILLATYIWHLYYCVELSDLLIFGFPFCLIIYDYWISWSLIYWLVPILHIYVYLCSPYRFSMHVFRFGLINIHVLLDFGFTIVPLISFMLLVIACTYMPEPHHLIMYMCDCLSTANWLYHMYSRSCFLITLDPHVQILESGPWWPCCSWSERAAEAWISIACPDPLCSSFPLFGLRDSHLTTREYFPVFYIVHPAFALLSDLIFLRYCIMPCDNCVLVLLLLECILPLCFRTPILVYTDA